MSPHAAVLSQITCTRCCVVTTNNAYARYRWNSELGDSLSPQNHTCLAGVHLHSQRTRSVVWRDCSPSAAR
jgi:hypothetical protein